MEERNCLKRLQNSPLSEGDAELKSISAGEVFRPALPINHLDLFIGRKQQREALVDAILQPGQHAVIFGERGVGKTSLANMIAPTIASIGKDWIVIKVNATTTDTFSSLWVKAFEEIRWDEEEPVVGYHAKGKNIPTDLKKFTGLGEKPTPDEVRRALSLAPKTVFIFDEFDRINLSEASAITDSIKMLSDFDVESTVVLVGIAKTIQQLIRRHASIDRGLAQIEMPRMLEPELESILTRGADRLGMTFSGKVVEKISHLSHGMPHYAHLLGLWTVRQACKRFSTDIGEEDLWGALTVSLSKVEAAIRDRYAKATASAREDAIYRHVLLACALTKTDAAGWFKIARVSDTLSKLLPEKKITPSTFARHIAELRSKKKRGSVLEEEGPQFRKRYRFRRPDFPPFVILKGVEDELITAEDALQFGLP